MSRIGPELQPAAAAQLAGRLDRPPPVAARAQLPEDFGRRFAIFGDAEEEFDWAAPLGREATSTEAIASLPVANRRFNDWGVVPTYLVDYPVVADPRSAAAMRQMAEDDACDIGTQLHPWVTPPFPESLAPRNSFAGNLPVETERAKLRRLHQQIEQATGRRSVVYRAGRYGIGPNTAQILEEAGYRLDVSVRSLFDYSDEGGPDFSEHPIWPYWVTGQLLELPLTAAFTGRWHGHRALHRARWSRAALARSGLLNRVALTPEGMPLKEALGAIERLLDADTRLFSLSFHTPSVEIGHTPYVRDAADLRGFWAWWEGVLGLFASRGVIPVRAGEIIAAADAGRPG